MTDDQKLRTAIDLVRALMRSTDSRKIRRIEYWSRAKSALETAAMSADSFSSLVSKMGHKLQIDCTTKTSGEIVGELAVAVGADFEAFRRYCAAESLYIIAICQAESKARAAEWEQKQEDEGRDPTGLDNYTV